MRLHSVRVFTDRYPWLGPIIWILSIQYFIVQVVVASAWQPGYSWRFNTISDLGNTVCDLQSSRPICSPLHGLMNISFIVLGLIIASGSVLIYQEFRESQYTLLGFSLMGIAGFGAIIVGLFPENTVPALHMLGAFMPFVFGNLSLLVLGVALYDISPLLRTLTFGAGALALISLGLLLSQHYGALGIGGAERLVAYPQTLWLIVFGIYTSHSHIMRIRAIQAIRKRLSASQGA